MTRPRVRDAGLSLVEVLVSLAIFSIIGVAGLAILNTVARTGERTEARLERLSEIDRALLIIRRDLAQIAPDRVTLGDGVIRFRRAAGESTVEMAFILDDTVLIRRIGSSGPDAIAQQILPGTAAVQWRLMDGARAWHEVWPLSGDTAEGRPLAAELSLDVWRAGSDSPDRMTRLIVLPAGQGQ
jgi:general secretion pathway protein J